MGTRADFYVGMDKNAEWLGSIAWDGHRSSIPDTILCATTEKIFRDQVGKFLATRDDATFPVQGWPWPWDTSDTTDCSYWFGEDRVWMEYDDRYLPADVEPPDFDDPKAEKRFLADKRKIKYPNMAKLKNVTYGPRSGIIIVGLK